jgi:hypothetical protein
LNGFLTLEYFECSVIGFEDYGELWVRELGHNAFFNSFCSLRMCRLLRLFGFFLAFLFVHGLCGIGYSSLFYSSTCAIFSCLFLCVCIEK